MKDAGISASQAAIGLRSPAASGFKPGHTSTDVPALASYRKRGLQRVVESRHPVSRRHQRDHGEAAIRSRNCLRWIRLTRAPLPGSARFCAKTGRGLYSLPKSKRMRMIMTTRPSPPEG
jgi:hypothetical protein